MMPPVDVATISEGNKQRITHALCIAQLNCDIASLIRSDTYQIIRFSVDADRLLGCAPLPIDDLDSHGLSFKSFGAEHEVLSTNFGQLLDDDDNRLVVSRLSFHHTLFHRYFIFNGSFELVHNLFLRPILGDGNHSRLIDTGKYIDSSLSFIHYPLIRFLLLFLVCSPRFFFVDFSQANRVQRMLHRPKHQCPMMNSITMVKMKKRDSVMNSITMTKVRKRSWHRPLIMVKIFHHPSLSFALPIIHHHSLVAS